ncbi:MAG: DMP19 family protein [Cyclobacteriaceae bacterium]|nr:DMP19 family protein [Cyclobacteriaceae bacterium]
MNKIDNLDSLLSSDDLNNSIIELDNFICELCEWGDNMNVLTDPQKNFYYNQNLEREINNGGFSQYFINSSGDFAHETINSLRAIRADHTANILQSAIDQFPDKMVPRDRDERTELVGRIEETANEKWEELDQKFFEYKDDLNSLNIEYVRKHRTQF